MAFEQITQTQYDKAMEILDARISVLDDAVTLRNNLVKIKNKFIKWYTEGDDVGVDYVKVQTLFDNINTEYRSLQTSLGDAEQDSYGASSNLFTQTISRITIRNAT